MKECSINIDISNFDSQLNCYPALNTYLAPILTLKATNQYVYNVLITNNETPTSKYKWENLLQTEDINWKNVYMFVFKCTKDTYIQWLQLRITHRILGTKSLLYKMKIVNDNLCSFCNLHEETIMHLFWGCNKVKSLIKYLETKVKEIDTKFLFNCSSLLLGTNKDQKWDIMFLEFKRYIFLCQRGKYLPTIQGLRSSFKLAIEINNNRMQENKNKFDHWTVVKQIVQNNE